MKKIKIPNNLIEKLIDLPEQGMNFQIVDVTLSNGDILKNRIISNCSLLLIDDSENIKTNQIINVDLTE